MIKVENSRVETISPGGYSLSGMSTIQNSRPCTTISNKRHFDFVSSNVQSAQKGHNTFIKEEENEESMTENRYVDPKNFPQSQYVKNFPNHAHNKQHERSRSEIRHHKYAAYTSGSNLGQNYNLTQSQGKLIISNID